MNYKLFDGRKIRIARKNISMTLRELSDRTGIPLRTLEKWESGKHEPQSVENLNKIALQLQCNINDFCVDSVNLQEIPTYTIWDSCDDDQKKALQQIIKDLMELQEDTNSSEYLYYKRMYESIKDCYK